MADKNTSALAGEFLVAGELARRGYSVSITMGNAKAVDIHAEYIDTTGKRMTVSIDVKASRYKTDWPVGNINRDVYYIFVYLQPLKKLNSEGVSNNIPPEYFVISGDEILDNNSEIVTKWTNMSGVKYATLNKSDYRERWDKLPHP